MKCSRLAELNSTRSIWIVDSYGSKLGWDDGCIRWTAIRDDEERWVDFHYDCRRSSKNFRWFEGTNHPSRLGYRIVELGSEEEGILIPMLSDWLDSFSPKPLMEFVWLQFRQDLVHHGDDPPFVPPVW